MGPLVSIIILPFEDDAYLERCVNSIKRQTYKNVEILVINSSENLKKEFTDCESVTCENLNSWQVIDEVMYKAKGQYVFFSDVTMIFEPCMIEKLVQNADQKMVMVNSKCIKENKMTDTDSGLFRITGKLYDKSIIMQNEIHFKTNEFCSELMFMLEYMCHCDELEERNDVYCYGTERTAMINDEGEIDSQSIKEYIEKIDTGLWNHSQKEKLLDLLLSMLNNSGNLSSNKQLIIETAVIVAKKFKNNPTIIYNLSKNQLQKPFEQVQEDDDNELWKDFQLFFAEIDNKDLQKVLFSVFNIDEIKYELLLKYSVHEYKFYEDKIGDKIENVVTTDNSQLLEEISILKDLVTKIESRPVITTAEKEIVYQSVSMQGNELGVYFVNECAAGKMGFSFIVKAMIGWIKYKFGKKKQY